MTAKKTDHDPFSDFLPQPKKCKLARVLEELDDPHADALRKALAMPPKEMSHLRIARVVTDWGHSVSDSSVEAHRAADCVCFR